MPYEFLGNEVYPFKYNLLRPYPAGSYEPVTKKEYFNKILSWSRKTVECACGIINTKWRILWRSIECDSQEVDHIILAICVLPNKVINRDGVTARKIKSGHVYSKRDMLNKKNPEECRQNQTAEIPRVVQDEFPDYFW